MKTVKYNGSGISFNGCSPAENLVEGNLYEVICINPVSAVQTNYILKGVDGEYCSSWFEDIPLKDNGYIAIGFTFPKEGKPYTCYRFCYDNENKPGPFIKCKTTMVKATRHIGGNIYEVKTLNSIYEVEVHIVEK